MVAHGRRRGGRGREKTIKTERDCKTKAHPPARNREKASLEEPDKPSLLWSKEGRMEMGPTRQHQECIISQRHPPVQF